MSKLGKIIRKIDPVAGLLHGKKKKFIPVPTPVAAKQGSLEEVSQRRKEVAARLRSNRKTIGLPSGARTTGSDEEFNSSRGSTLLGN